MSNTSSFGLSSLKYSATKIWDIVPYEIKSVGNLNLFKTEKRNWERKRCHSRLCKQYLHDVGYVDTFLFLLLLAIIVIF